MKYTSYKFKSVYLFRTLFAVLLICMGPMHLSHAQQNIPGTLAVGGGDLNLNGHGMRKKAFISLYRCGLYLDQPNQDAAAIISADTAMAIRIVIESGFISSKKMQTAMVEGFDKSTGGNTAPIADEIETFKSGFSDEIVKRDVFDLVYQPGTGVEVIKNGESKVTAGDLGFKQALFGIWLSEDPVQKSLKKALLGGS
ncbi:MAG: chalcone isomerase family protein [bacterium]